MEWRVQSLDDMGALAAEVLAALPQGGSAASILALSGDLGAGKTTLTQSLARQLGVEEAVASPTFVIQKMYALKGKPWRKLVHIDAYRLKNADELRRLGWHELAADRDNLIVIEWPENVPDAIPEEARRIRIKIGQGDERVITYG